MISHRVQVGANYAEIRLGRWQDVLAGVECDAVITDPPYGARTHEGQDVEGYDTKLPALKYASLAPAQVSEWAAAWCAMSRGWVSAMTSDDLSEHWRSAYGAAGRMDFAPLWIVQNSVRMGGDGPASPGVYMCVSRPRCLPFSRWGSLPGHYKSSRGDIMPGLKKAYPGGKALKLMREIVGHYSRPGDLIVDPCAGVGSTLAAAVLTGRNAIGAEMDPTAYADCCKVLDAVSAQGVLL